MSFKHKSNDKVVIDLNLALTLYEDGQMLQFVYRSLENVIPGICNYVT